jgi:hypothetical protein
MTLHLALRKGVRAVALAVFFGVAFTLAGIVIGLIIGLAVSGFYEEVLTVGNAQGPLLMLVTGPIGGLVGLVFGFRKGLTMRDPDPRLNKQAP